MMVMMTGGRPGCPPGVDPNLYSWFVAVDADGSGQISAKELQAALTNGNWSNFNPETCRLMIGKWHQDPPPFEILGSGLTTPISVNTLNLMSSSPHDNFLFRII